MTNPAGALPLFAQVEADLRQRIVANELAPGTQLASEAAMSAHYGVSRITIRQALAMLRSDGLIDKINGKGSFVTRPADAPPLGPLTGLSEHLRAQGHSAHGRTLSLREVAARGVPAAALRVAPGTPLLALRTLRYADERPLALATTHAAPPLMQALLREDINRFDLMTLLEARLGLRLQCTQVETEAVAANASQARTLALPPGAPLLRIDFVPLDLSGRALFHSRMWFRGDGFRYRAVVRR